MSGEPKDFGSQWDPFSEGWEKREGQGLGHLGDEWEDIDICSRFVFENFCVPWVKILRKYKAGARLSGLEIGPGGGKYTVQLAGIVDSLQFVDVAPNMIRRTTQRMKEKFPSYPFAGHVLGEDCIFPSAVSSQRYDFVFSYDVFVHLPTDDVLNYLLQARAAMSPCSFFVVHLANAMAEGGMNKLFHDHQYYANFRNPRGRFFYHTPSQIRMLAKRCGFVIREVHESLRDMIFVLWIPEKDETNSSPKFGRRDV